jgi:aminotransferase
MVVSDEVYATYTFDGREHVSVADLPELADRSIAIGSLSKSHAISGWRVGFLRAKPEHTTVLRQVHVSVTGGTSAPLQRAVAAGLASGPSWEPAPVMQGLRDRVVETFSAVGVKCGQVEGGCYVMADIRPVTEDASPLYVERLLQRTGVLIVPGTYFYADQRHGEPFVRIAFNKSPETLREAHDRVAHNCVAAPEPEV